ncbi:hypothetical protein GN958_ATG04120 [Phytophthora infestans]|uniref:Uncharacterized protein n=1 Tax=Phytophthora infestans TaxID=4787 RepID=A0A8S9V3P9_PHYIN|nr:hypothetical protein GN958_ATG04120 [Phytophthora infestans]
MAVMLTGDEDKVVEVHAAALAVPGVPTVQTLRFSVVAAATPMWRCTQRQRRKSVLRKFAADYSVRLTNVYVSWFCYAYSVCVVRGREHGAPAKTDNVALVFNVVALAVVLSTTVQDLRIPVVAEMVPWLFKVRASLYAFLLARLT